MQLPRSFFAQPTLTVARALIGKRLVKQEPDGALLSGIISETEAYIGEVDLACHAKAGRTARTIGLYDVPGTIYVYFTYGMHWMLNIVTEQKDFPSGVLLRGIFPEAGLPLMRLRRKRPDKELTNGPAKLAQALAISKDWYGYDICQTNSVLFVEDAPAVPDAAILRQARIGIPNVPDPWKSLPWNFKLKQNYEFERND